MRSYVTVVLGRSLLSLYLAAGSACAHHKQAPADAGPALYTLDLGGNPFPVRQVFFTSYTPSYSASDNPADPAGNNTDPQGTGGDPAISTPPQPIVQVILSSSEQGCAAIKQGGNNKNSMALTITLSAADPNGLPLPVTPGTYTQATADSSMPTGTVMAAEFEVGTYDDTCNESLAGQSTIVDQGTLTLATLGSDATGSYSFTLAGSDGTAIAHGFTATSCPLDADAFNELNPSPPCL